MRCDEIRVANPGGRPSTVVSVVGEVDWTTSRELRAEVRKVLTADQSARLILDLRNVTHIDSSGVGALLEGLHDANNRHVRFTLSGLNSSLRRILERTHLNILFDIYPTVEEALQTSRNLLKKAQEQDTASVL